MIKRQTRTQQVGREGSWRVLLNSYNPENIPTVYTFIDAPKQERRAYNFFAKKLVKLGVGDALSIIAPSGAIMRRATGVTTP